MENDRIIQKENSHDVSIALIQKDMQYCRESLGKMEITLTLMDRNYTKRDEFNGVVKLIEDIGKKLETKADHADIKTLSEVLKGKVDNSDFDPIKKTLAKINWLMIAGVVVALLSLIINTSK